ncbi:eukaryotic translation initiation factor 5B-like [Haliotis cracherodii]|uniref:eukaryotic translation initiation factor 5B-like n=1 Tax=Haliotis cracherodii TaxID=6455 RepID=UPI0039ECC2A1
MARVAALVLLVVVLAQLGSSQDVNAKEGDKDEKKLASSQKKLQEQMKGGTKKLEKFKTLQGGMKALGKSQKNMTKRADKLENKLKGISRAAKIKELKKATIAKESATSEATSILGVRIKGKLLAKDKAAQARQAKPKSAKAKGTTVPHTGVAKFRKSLMRNPHVSDVLPRKRRSLLGGKGLFKNHHKIGESMKLKFSVMKKRHQERMASMKKRLSEMNARTANRMSKLKEKIEDENARTAERMLELKDKIDGLIHRRSDENDLEYDDGDYGSAEDMEAGKVDEEVLDLGEEKDKGKSVKRSPKKIFQDLEYDDGDYGSAEDMEAGKVDEEVLDLGEEKDKGKSVKRSPKKIFQGMKERHHKRMASMKKKISDFKQRAASDLAGMRSIFEV